MEVDIDGNNLQLMKNGHHLEGGEYNNIIKYTKIYNIYFLERYLMG